MIVSHGVGADRRVLLADANPAIGTLPVATLTPLIEPSRPPAELAGFSRAPSEFSVPRRVNGPVTDQRGRTRPPEGGERIASGHDG
jgi:hypothetical protein